MAGKSKEQLNILISAWGYPRPGVKGNPFVADQARALARSGNNISLLEIEFANPLTAISKYLRSRKLVKQEQKHGIKIIYTLYINIIPAHTFKFLLGLQKKMIFTIVWLRLKCHLIFNKKPDIIHQHYSVNGTPFITSLISDHFKIPYIITEHSPGLDSHQAISSKSSHYFSTQDIYRFVLKARNAIAVSNKYADIFSGLFQRKFHVIPNMIPDKFLSPPSSSKAGNPFFFINIGDLVDRKGQENLIKAFHQKFKDKKNVQLKVVGDGPLKKSLQELSKQLKTSTQVHFMGRLNRPEILEQLHESHVLVVSSKKETFNVTIIEGMATGLPIVATKCGGPEELITPETGLLSELSVNSLADKMEAIYKNYQKYDSEKIIEWAKKNYSEEVIVKRLIDTYNEAINQKSIQVA